MCDLYNVHVDIVDSHGRNTGTIWPVTLTTTPSRNTSEFTLLRMTLICGLPESPSGQCRVQWWVQCLVASWVKRSRIFDTAIVSGTRTADGPVPSQSVLRKLALLFFNTFINSFHLILLPLYCRSIELDSQSEIIADRLRQRRQLGKCSSLRHGLTRPPSVMFIIIIIISDVQSFFLFILYDTIKTRM